MSEIEIKSGQIYRVIENGVFKEGAEITIITAPGSSEYDSPSSIRMDYSSGKGEIHSRITTVSRHYLETYCVLVNRDDSLKTEHGKNCDQCNRAYEPDELDEKDGHRAFDILKSMVR